VSWDQSFVLITNQSVLEQSLALNCVDTDAMIKDSHRAHSKQEKTYSHGCQCRLTHLKTALSEGREDLQTANRNKLCSHKNNHQGSAHISAG
jgi:hypothetical protein